MKSTYYILFGIMISFNFTNVFGEEIPMRFISFVENRDHAAKKLINPIIYCMSREDTNHAIFHGCVDWHSSVHAHWALAAYIIRTNDKIVRKVLKDSISKNGVDRELDFLKKHPQFEMPYGRAWFLKLAVDYNIAFPNDTTLNQMASEIAESLFNYYKKYKPDLRNESSYESDAWALINLLEYGEHTKDAKYLSFVREQVSAVLSQSKACPNLSMQKSNLGFFPVCLLWAWLGLEVGINDNPRYWVEGFLGDVSAIIPIETPATLHQHGLNMSRSWALWEIYRRTADIKFLEGYIQHFNRGMNSSIGQNNYSLAHWVPQFAFFALDRSYRR